jgi:hypothetical protein
MFMANNGDVGIGTGNTAPVSKLQVAGTITTAGLTSTNLITANGGLLSAGLITANGFGLISKASGNDASIKTQNSASANGTLIIANNVSYQAYNATTQTNDAVIVYSNDAPGTSATSTALNICSWNGSAGGDGIRLTPTSTTINTPLISTGLITANGGITMGGSNRITLGSGTTAPTAGQLGYTIRYNNSGVAINNANTQLNTGSLTAGVWMLCYTLNFAGQSTGNANIYKSFCGFGPAPFNADIAVNQTASTGFVIGPYAHTGTCVLTYTTTTSWYFNATINTSDPGGVGWVLQVSATRIA